MATQPALGAEEKTPPRQRRAGRGGAREAVAAPSGTHTATGLTIKIALLGVAGALAVWAAFPLVADRAWAPLAILVAATAALLAVYLSRRRIALKYLVPGTLLLIAFQVVPVLYTASTAFTNFGDGHRGSKQEAIASIQSASVRQAPGTAEYALTVATKDDALVFLLADPSGHAYVGDARGLRPLAGATLAGGRIAAAPGYTVLNLGQASARGAEVTALSVPTDDGAIRANGLTRAFDGKAAQRYDAACDCVTDVDTGHVWKADNDDGVFVDASGARLPQGWRVDVGLRNFATVLTDSRVSSHFAGTLAWNLAFAFLSVFVTFALGLGCALALNAPRLRGRSVYRVLLVLPYAMPSFAMLLVWADMFNQDFGLINKLLGLDVDWFGGAWTARAAVIVIQMWLGYPYMFLVSTGALQAIPKELIDAARVDGAGAWARFRTVTLPLLLVALTPLLISSFAFNFNNFNAVQLTTQGGPFAPDDPTAGATDLLITYTYRLAFGGSGAQFGFAAAVSIYIFAIVAVISMISFRRTRAQEEVYA